MSLFTRLRRPRTRLPGVASKPGVIGLDLGAHTLNLCQLRRLSDNTFQIIAKSNTGYPQSRQELLESTSVL